MANYFSHDSNARSRTEIIRLRMKYGWEGYERKRMYNTNVQEWMRIRREVFERDHYICQYCGKIGGTLEVDHIIPFSKGGSDNIENLITSCRKCNRQKKDKSVEEFIMWRKEHGTE